MKAANELGGPVWVVKAQIHAGGRGKAGGVKVVKSIDDVKKEADAPARLDPGHAPDRPARQAGQPPLHRGRLRRSTRSSTCRCWSTARRSRVAIVVSTEGGMDIEKVAHDTPDKIVTISVDPATGICPHHVRRVAKALGLDADLQKQARARC